MGQVPVSAATTVWRRRGTVVALACGFLATNLVFFLWYRSTQRLRAQGLERERAALAVDTAAREQEATRLIVQRDRIAHVSQAIQEFYGKKVGRRREALAPLVDEMHGVFRRTGIFPAQISYATEPLESLSLTQMLVSFGYTTDYPSFKKLLAAIESDPHWLVVRKVSVTRDTATPSAVQMHMVLATYFTPEDEGPPRPATHRPGAASEGRRTVAGGARRTSR
jgi:Tfp pilus assembly protein PilN